MRNSKGVYSEIISRIHINEGQDEKNAIGAFLMDHLFGISRPEILTNKPVAWTSEIETRVQALLERINSGEPVQYVTGEAWFLGEKYKVGPNVLIPRPETEEMVQEAIKHIVSLGPRQVVVLDIGTGSGCIPISLALRTHASLVATDISAEALRVAQENARIHHVNVTFLQHDILRDRLPFHAVDLLMSNPPYIARAEQKLMNDSVTRFEPHLALFVPDDDPLCFYRRIAQEGRKILNEKGMIIVEINERYGDDVKELFLANGYTDVCIVRDLSGKNRMVKAFQS